MTSDSGTFPPLPTSQLGIGDVVRYLTTLNNEGHRVYRDSSQLLSGGHSLLLGHSLNSLHKNEAVHVESDTEDRPFFDATWATATPVT
jgi:hypothetical protein